MAEGSREQQPRILVLATGACAYPGADSVGQIHAECPTNVYIIRVPAPVLFSRDFYFRSFEKGISGIIVMSCGHECPFPGAYARLAKRMDQAHQDMKRRGLDPRRLRLCAICTVCTRAFLKEVRQMAEIVAGGS
jgi:coenzyme F420-reducing hydrogenase delta subunit